jgi:uncharacterized protein (DUF1810 family)
MLSRFHKAQENGITGRNSTYAQALQEIGKGKKIGHWIWYILPQLASRGKSQTAKYYGIADFDKACQYLEDAVLFERYHTMVKEIEKQLIKKAVPVDVLMGQDVKKLASSLTLFRAAASHLAGQPGSKKHFKQLEECCTRIFENQKINVRPCNDTLEEIANYNCITSQLNAYVGTRKTKWQFYFNFLSIVSFFYFVKDYFLGTDDWYIKSHDIKISAATKLGQITDPDCLEKPILTEHEKKALQEGRLGTLVTMHGGLEKLLQVDVSQPLRKTTLRPR